MPQFAYGVIGTAISSIAKWFNGTDLCSIRNWVIGNKNDSFCKLGSTGPIFAQVHIGASGAKIAQLRTGSCGPTLNPNVKCVQGKGALQAHLLA